MTQPNRPAPRFAPADWVWTPADWRGWVEEIVWADGEWAYRIVQPNAEQIRLYAEHELTEAGR